jgi:hypothetical protein
MFESDWLEAKPAPYRLDKEAEAFELAKDVAALANAAGGIIVIGARTKNRPAGDEIRRINECRIDEISPRRYVSFVRRKVFPRVDGFKVELTPGASAGRGGRPPNDPGATGGRTTLPRPRHRPGRTRDRARVHMADPRGSGHGRAEC